MLKISVLTAWVGNGTTIPHHPQLADDFPLLSWVDVTGQSPVPPPTNLFIVEALADDQTVDAIASDGRYSILWAEPEPAE